ncbi:hypothetical protein AB8615_07175 [Litorimonas sp. RW-G-Af-16]|uniref:hypothetical protein n=1 Tax=Litorimonas sp. RW-G-Af-16 TaxID=3241168 RepID=UPI003AACD104
MSIFNIFRRRKKHSIVRASQPPIIPQAPKVHPATSDNSMELKVRRYFHNTQGFQCYTTWFTHWGGWVSAGHCVTEANDHLPDFVVGETTSWPDGLDAALAGCRLPDQRSSAPVIGRDVILYGFPAGSRTMERRTGRVYFERGAGTWIAHIFEPDEPVVTGMSGGPVVDAKTQEPLGIIITRNSPADLNNDRDPDESADFIALSAVWDALNPKMV